MSEATPHKVVRFGTFTGVFTPTLLTILGVIMYVRMGWVVGNAGLAGAMGILGLGLLITTCTGLSLSSIATNTRIGAGGPYAIMNKSLGVEVGGAIGIPLYLTRPLGVAMYIIGFREGLLWIVPSLPPLAVDVLVFAVLFGIAFKSADLAFKTQYAIMGVIALSLVSIYASPVSWTSEVPLVAWGSYPGAPVVPGDPATAFVPTDFWGVFAVFFPATTGILAGANMSGDLKDPRRAIPVGTLAAIVVSSILYFAIAWWCASTGTPTELTTNYNHIIDNSLFPPLVLAGLLGATASSALAGLVGGPRILMAMGENRIIPWSERIAKTTRGEPRAAMLVTGVLTLAAIAVRDLNAIAPLVTMFFLITYSMINFVVLLEGSLGLVSYRPTLRIPLLVPLIGFVGSIFSMFIVNPTFGLVSVFLVLVAYAYMRSRRQTDKPGKENVRSAIFVALAEWAAGRVTPEDRENVRAWKPHVLVPVEDAEDLRGTLTMLEELARPEGSIQILGIGTRHEPRELLTRIEVLGRSVAAQGHRVFWTMLPIDDVKSAITVGMMALQGAFFRPNLLFLRHGQDPAGDPTLLELIRSAAETRVGVLLMGIHHAAGFGERRSIRLWIHPTPDWDANRAFDHGGLDLTLLMGFRLWRVWRGDLRVTVVASSESEGAAARGYLDEICDLARFPAHVHREVLFGDMATSVRAAPVVDLSIFGLRRDVASLEWARHMVIVSRSSCMFVINSGRESARA